MTKHVRLNIFNLGNNSIYNGTEAYAVAHSLFELGDSPMFEFEIQEAVEMEFPDEA